MSRRWGSTRRGQAQFAALLEAVHKQTGVTMLVVSHDIRAIAAGCDRVACLSRRLHFHDAPSGLTPSVLAEVFAHDVAGLTGVGSLAGMHVHAHGPGESCPLDHAHVHAQPTAPVQLSVKKFRRDCRGWEVNLWSVMSDLDTAWPLLIRPLLIGAALCVMCGVLSVPVVLKRLSFAGQGISHSAFGGIGLAALLGVLLTQRGGVAGVGEGGLLEFAIVLVFCVGAALLMAAVGDRKTTHEDTGIGMLLVSAMALGGLLVELSRQVATARGVTSSSQTWESVLFGSVMVAGDRDVWLAWGVAALVIGAAWWWRRPLVFWTLDEQSAPVFGVPAARMRTVLMVLLAVAVVTSMKLAGVVPATALLVLPGAIALRLGSSLKQVIALAMGSSVVGLVVALVLAVAINVQPGPTLVLVMTAAYGVVVVLKKR